MVQPARGSASRRVSQGTMETLEGGTHGGMPVRCTRIYFRGWKRLADAECDVTPRLLAFVGQNEAGKSTVLQGLEWLSEDGATPVARLDRSRAKKVDKGWMVGAVFRLDPADLALIESLNFDEVPTQLSIWKQADGSLEYAFRRPENPKRDASPFEAAGDALRGALEKLSKAFAASDQQDIAEGREARSQAAKRLLALLAEPDQDWSDEHVADATSLADWLAQVPDGRKTPLDGKTSALLLAASSVGSDEHPAETALDLLRDRVPKFVQFRPEDRVLPTLSTPNGRGAMVLGPAPRNIFSLAGISAQALWNAHSEGDTGEVASLQEEAQGRLDDFFEQAWNQSNISVSLDTHADGLLIHTFEIDTRRHTRMEERSDGLRTFIALAAFLEAQQFDVPPILLLDEAEMHLHLNAQADLVGVLLNQVKATQVIYTTHSPGCLPSDLGTGIRLVERVDSQTSKIKSHFWTNDAPGYSPLLFSMGASAAAFSVCRRAVLAEGASDMVLLPTLFRLATGLGDLKFQVAPGLANARSHGMRIEEVAARVVYLTDGDRQGRQYKKDLVNLAKVADDRIFALPADMATEDLLDVDFLLDVVTKMLPASSPSPTRKNIGTTRPIMLALDRWSARQAPPMTMPGKVALAYAIIEREDIRLKPEGVSALRDLHRRIDEAFGDE